MSEEKKDTKIEKNKGIKHINKRLIIVILLLLVVVVSSTFAWFTYRSRQSALVLTVGDIDSTRITLYPYEFTGTLDPVNSYDNVSYVQITAINNNQTASSFKLSYNAEQIPEELRSDFVKYTIIKSNIIDDEGYEFYKEGDLSELTIENPIILLENEELEPNSTTYYRVYLWLDNNSGDHSELQGKNLSVTLNVELLGKNEEPEPQETIQINANKYRCDVSDLGVGLGVYFIESCTGNECSYSTRNGLDSSYDFSNDWNINPTWTIDKNSYSDSLNGIDGACPLQKMYVDTDSTRLNCREIPSTKTSDNKIVPIVKKFNRCASVDVYQTTLQYSDADGVLGNFWYYSKNYGCYLSGNYLSNNKPSGCSSSSSGSGTETQQTVVYCYAPKYYYCNAENYDYYITNTSNLPSGCTLVSSGWSGSDGYSYYSCPK